MTDVPTIYDRLADDLASLQVPNITIKLSPENGLRYEDFLLLKQSVSVRHPAISVTVQPLPLAGTHTD